MQKTHSLTLGINWIEMPSESGAKVHNLLKVTVYKDWSVRTQRQWAGGNFSHCYLLSRAATTLWFLRVFHLMILKLLPTFSNLTAHLTPRSVPNLHFGSFSQLWETFWPESPWGWGLCPRTDSGMALTWHTGGAQPRERWSGLESRAISPWRPPFGKWWLRTNRVFWRSEKKLKLCPHGIERNVRY